VAGELPSVHGLVHVGQRLGAEESRCQELVVGGDLDLLECEVQDRTDVDDEPGHGWVGRLLLGAKRMLRRRHPSHDPLDRRRHVDRHQARLRMLSRPDAEELIDERQTDLVDP